MSTVLKFRRGNTTAANAFTGQAGELFVDTTKNALVVHDGVTTGGTVLATESYVTTQINNLIAGAPSALNTLNELATALGNDSNYATTITTALSGKVSLSGSYSNPTWITSLAYSKLSGAPSLATVATSGSYTDLINKPTLFSGSYTDLTNKPTLFSGSYTDLTNKPTLATVATSGSYTDLINTPTIQSFNQSLNTSDSVTFANVTTGGLISAGVLSIQSGSNKSINLNPANGIVHIGLNDVLHSGNVKTINGNSIYGTGDITISGGGSITVNTNAPSGNGALSVSSGTALDFTPADLSTKQNTLVSGSNIKTINGQSLLGGGNITISGGSGGGSTLTYGQFTDNEVDLTTTTANQVIDSFPAASYRTSKYIIQAVCDTVGLHSTEIILIHDGSTVYITEYGTIFTDSSLFTIDANITAGAVNLTVTPVNPNTSFDVVRTSLAARTFTAPSLQGDLMLLSGSEDLQTATGSADLNV